MTDNAPATVADTPTDDVALDGKSMKGWAIANRSDVKTGTYFFLNVGRAKGGAITVKARMDGTYLCLAHECLQEGKAMWRPGASNARVCAHARFIAANDPDVHNAGKETAPTNAPAHTDDDAPSDAARADALHDSLDDDADALL